MQVIGRNKSIKPFRMRWEGVDVEVCSLKAGTGNLIKSLEPQQHTKLDTCMGSRLLCPYRLMETRLAPGILEQVQPPV